MTFGTPVYIQALLIPLYSGRWIVHSKVSGLFNDCPVSRTNFPAVTGLLFKQRGLCV